MADTFAQLVTGHAGEVKILSSDIVYDMGWSLNPAIDIGQVEGAFVQGIGYLLTEKLVFQGTGDDKGRLNTTNTWRYKIPAVTTIPLEMNTHLFPRDDASEKNIPDDSNEIFSANEVGELCSSAVGRDPDFVAPRRIVFTIEPPERPDLPAHSLRDRAECPCDDIGFGARAI